MKIYIYAQHTSRAGEIFRGDESAAEGSDDFVLFGEGTEEELASQAREILRDQPKAETWCLYAQAVLRYLNEV